MYAPHHGSTPLDRLAKWMAGKTSVCVRWSAAGGKTQKLRPNGFAARFCLLYLRETAKRKPMMASLCGHSLSSKYTRTPAASTGDAAIDLQTSSSHCQHPTNTWANACSNTCSGDRLATADTRNHWRHRHAPATGSLLPVHSTLARRSLRSPVGCLYLPNIIGLCGHERR